MRVNGNSICTPIILLSLHYAVFAFKARTLTLKRSFFQSFSREVKRDQYGYEIKDKDWFNGTAGY